MVRENKTPFDPIPTTSPWRRVVASKYLYRDTLRETVSNNTVSYNYCVLCGEFFCERDKSAVVECLILEAGGAV